MKAVRRERDGEVGGDEAVATWLMSCRSTRDEGFVERASAWQTLSTSWERRRVCVCVRVCAREEEGWAPRGWEGRGGVLATLNIKPIMLSRSGCGYMDSEQVIGLNAGGGVGGVTLF